MLRYLDQIGYCIRENIRKGEVIFESAMNLIYNFKSEFASDCLSIIIDCKSFSLCTRTQRSTGDGGRPLLKCVFLAPNAQAELVNQWQSRQS